MKKQISIFLLLFISLSTIQAQKLESVEKKVFSYLINNLKEEQLPILSYCLSIDLDSASFDRVKNELIKTSKSSELKKVFYKNGNQFDKEWVEVLLNPTIKYSNGKPEHLLTEIEFDLLNIDIIKYTHDNISDINILKEKIKKYLEADFKSKDLKNEEKIWSTSYNNSLQNSIQYIIDSGNITPSIKDKYYKNSFYATKQIDPLYLLNPHIYKNIKLFNLEESRLLRKEYPYTPTTDKNSCCDIIFVGAEENASFPGGEAALFKYIRENIKYPSSAREYNITGKVLIRFTIDKEGNICNVEAIKKVSPDLDSEAIRVIKSMPKWTPAKNDGKPVCLYFNLPINFQ